MIYDSRKNDSVRKVRPHSRMRAASGVPENQGIRIKAIGVLMPNYTMNDSATAAQAPMKRSVLKRSLILDTAMRHFAENGYEAAHMGDMANQLGIAKGSVFQHFGSKDGLFFEAYKSALRSLPPYLEVPADVREAGFFAVVRHRLSLAPQFLEKYRVPYRVVLLGNYGSDLALKKRIVSFVASEDPIGMAAFVQMGIDRGEVRTDVDQSLIKKMLECSFEHMHDFLLTEEIDPELFHRTTALNGNKAQMIDQFVTVLRGAIGTPPQA
jgi:TetR/AcrR family transcriptional regulator